MRINVGCGKTPTEGWRNLDNSLSLRLAKLGPWGALAHRVGVLNDEQLAFLQFAQTHKIQYCDATKGLPFADDSVDVIYSSHMFEHLDQPGARAFLSEALRVLEPGGRIRLVVPDIGKLVKEYLQTGDADVLVSATMLAAEAPTTFVAKLQMSLVGFRGHRWMYDGHSLCRLLSLNGFVDAQIMGVGQTFIVTPDQLDLYERDRESTCVEAAKPF